MSEHTEHKWVSMLKAYFGLSLTATDQAIWTEELEQIQWIDSGKIEKAIQFGARQDRDRYSGKITLRDLKIWLFSLRKQERLYETGPGGCGQCRNGWLTFAPKLPASFGPEEWLYAEHAEIPCDCSAGYKLKTDICSDYKQLDEDERQSLKRQFDLAKAQQVAINRATQEGTRQ